MLVALADLSVAKTGILYAAWEPFRDLIPEDERGCFIKAYHKRLNSEDVEIQVRYT